MQALRGARGPGLDRSHGGWEDAEVQGEPSPQGGSPVSGDAEGASRLVWWPLPDSSGPLAPFRSCQKEAPAKGVGQVLARREGFRHFLQSLDSSPGFPVVGDRLLLPALPAPCPRHRRALPRGHTTPGQATGKGGAEALRSKVAWDPGPRAAPCALGHSVPRPPSRPHPSLPDPCGRTLARAAPAPSAPGGQGPGACARPCSEAPCTLGKEDTPERV